MYVTVTKNMKFITILKRVRYFDVMIQYFCKYMQHWHSYVFDLQEGNGYFIFPSAIHYQNRSTNDLNGLSTEKRYCRRYLLKISLFLIDGLTIGSLYAWFQCKRQVK
jgi:hypothetical protein